MSSSNEILLKKQHIRTIMNRRLSKLTDDQVSRETQSVLTQLFRHPYITPQSCLLMYSALSDEFNLNELFFWRIKRRYRTCFPILTSNRIEAVSIDRKMDCGDWEHRDGFLQPNLSCSSKIDPRSIDCVLVPGKAFDKNRVRLGRGGGHYDRFLKTIPQAYKIGLSFLCQITHQLPKEKHDIIMDEVLVCS